MMPGHFSVQYDSKSIEDDGNLGHRTVHPMTTLSTKPPLPQIAHTSKHVLHLPFCRDQPSDHLYKSLAEVVPLPIYVR